MHGRRVNPDAKTEAGAQRWLLDWGDRLCCGTLLTAGLAGASLLGWWVWQMPALR